CRQVNFSGRCFLDSNSWALKIQRVASLKFSAFVSRMKRCEFQRLSTSFRFLTLKSQCQYNQIYELIQLFSF
ncbi:TPA: hypothetical protein I7694_22470, partial [Vibrio vulnificus]|nr:hypothetical protein [Vibrio vulnificus]